MSEPSVACFRCGMSVWANRQCLGCGARYVSRRSKRGTAKPGAPTLTRRMRDVPEPPIPVAGAAMSEYEALRERLWREQAEDDAEQQERGVRGSVTGVPVTPWVAT